VAKDTLTPKQERFVQEYLKDLNATGAAKRAGYGEKGAHVAGSRLLKDRKVRAAVDAAQNKRAQRTQVTADRIIQELSAVAFSDLALAFDKGGQLLPLHEMPDTARAALAGVDTEELFEGRGEERQLKGLGRKVRNWDKVRALELLMKHNGMLREKVELSGEDGGPVVVEVRTYKDGGA
jgi:phage terminase small subunit